MLADISRYTTEEFFTGDILGHTTNIARSKLHGITAIRTKQTVAILTLRGAAVDDSYKVIVYDDSVLAFLLGVLGVLGDDCLFYNLHENVYNLCVSFYYQNASFCCLFVDL